ncbi:type IV secretion system protein VirB9 [Campylobacter jejuni]|nr:type IV secretion system protein VirB9 [Campylobacter jejuni]
MISFNIVNAEIPYIEDNNQTINATNENIYGENILNDGNSNKAKNYIQTNILPNKQENNYNNYDNFQYQNQNELYYQNENGQKIEKEQLELMKQALKNQNLNALQKRFFQKKYSGYENTLNLNYQENKTEKIRTRFAMATTIIFQTDITNYILGDTTGFKVEEIPNLPNAIAIKPLLIGIDTSLTIFTKDNKIHTFYIFSTDYKNSKDPNLIVYIKDDKTQNLIDEKNEKINKEYLIIKEGIAEVRVKKTDIYNHYLQKGTNPNKWLVAEEIFDDKKFTYFKYDKKKMPQIPAIFAVIDNQDSPVESRVIGNYIIAETTAKKFTIRSGNSYICVEKIDPPKAKK